MYPAQLHQAIFEFKFSLNTIEKHLYAHGRTQTLTPEVK